MPLCPPRSRTRRGGGGGERAGGISGGSFFFDERRDGARPGPFSCPYVLTCVDPSRELSDLTWSSSKRFSACGPLFVTRLFSSPKMAETRPTWPYPAFLSLSLSPRGSPLISFFHSLAYSRVFFPFLQRKGGRGTLRIQWRLSISDESFVAVAVGRSSSSINTPASFGL